MTPCFFLSFISFFSFFISWPRAYAVSFFLTLAAFVKCSQLLVSLLLHVTRHDCQMMSSFLYTWIRGKTGGSGMLWVAFIYFAGMVWPCHRGKHHCESLLLNDHLSCSIKPFYLGLFQDDSSPISRTWGLTERFGWEWKMMWIKCCEIQCPNFNSVEHLWEILAWRVCTLHYHHQNIIIFLKYLKYFRRVDVLLGLIWIS